MSQTQVVNINPIGPGGVVRCSHNQKVWLQTSRTDANPNRKFFTCYKPRSSGDRCSFFVWLRDIRRDPDWDEALFRSAYDIRPEDNIEGVILSQSSQKRHVEEDPFTSSQSPKRSRCDQDVPNDGPERSARPIAVTAGAIQSGPTTPTRNGSLGDQYRHLPMTPPSTSFSRARRQLAEVPSSPSEEGIRRRDQSRSLHLQNFDTSMGEISPLSSRESPQSLSASASADDLEMMISTLSPYPDLIRKYERKSSADKRALEARIRRVHQLETELERVKRENEKLIQENLELTRQNVEFSKYLG